MKNRQKHSSKDMSRDMKYLVNVPSQERETAEIRRNKHTISGKEGAVEIWRNGLLTWSSETEKQTI